MMQWRKCWDLFQKLTLNCLDLCLENSSSHDINAYEKIVSIKFFEIMTICFSDAKWSSSSKGAFQLYFKLSPI